GLGGILLGAVARISAEEPVESIITEGVCLFNPQPDIGYLLLRVTLLKELNIVRIGCLCVWNLNHFLPDVGA
ncbi:MAG: hypothetical protein V3U00_07595, partial [Gammaproteobacteria bacterium]